tara:strand:- start:501 stop:827 length:327 start_codon:yes stop_codon:yes gene_type:complete
MQEPVQEPVGQLGLFDVEGYEKPQEVEVPTEEILQDVALNAIGKIPMQDFINDAVQALVEVYKMKPEIFQLDVDNYDSYPPLVANPFTDLVTYLRELNRETGTLNGAD